MPEPVTDLIRAGDRIAGRLSRAPGIDIMRQGDLEAWDAAKRAARAPQDRETEIRWLREIIANHGGEEARARLRSMDDPGGGS
jgi:hypothetical protein